MREPDYRGTGIAVIVMAVLLAIVNIFHFITWGF